jgi:hypothetical protein
VTPEERLEALEAKVDRILTILEEIVATFAPYAKRLKVRSTGLLAKMTKERSGL